MNRKVDKRAIALRVKRLRTELNLTQKALGDVCGVSRGAVWQWEDERTTPDRDALMALERKKNVSPDWVLYGDEPMIVESEASDLDGLVSYVHRLDGAMLSAGPGSVNFEHDLVDKFLPFRKDWLEHRGLNPDMCRLMEVKGDSQAPGIQDGDTVLINLEYGRLESGQMYAIAVGDEWRLKRVFKRSDGTVLLSSDNENKRLYPDESLRGDEVDGLAIIGKQVWRAG